MNILDRIQSLIDYDLKYMEEPEADAVKTDLQSIFYTVKDMRDKMKNSKKERM